ncbi:DUF1120 domain-containing protein [Herbaspirillum sp. RTI4]|uniref:DUF1120 domain-containing protein n=1 Tax=Herbaspirillum sp. RTI4 TaxID=3048640 RepID=UPI002AB33249|nr:DUF1120 domain-containing protein [Herbaspirillum sp. RTI4]MDY7577723.1 DUF1120 domain-containing protein [Herbaspirillum sp. RTI4]MEA9980849.1 DUF1120 domain-containing protein [Herbaspirillum sp. RTI4]
MNNIQKLGGFAFLLGLAGYAGAATPASSALNLSAKITMPACDANIVSEVDYGVIPRGSLNPGEANYLSEKAITLEVSCNMDTLIWVKVTDDNPGTDMKPDTPLPTQVMGSTLITLPSESLLGLGRFAPNVSIGAYALQFEKPTVTKNDGTSVDAYLDVTDTVAACASACGYLNEKFFDSRKPYITTTTGGGTSWSNAAGKEFSFPIKVLTTLNEGALLAGTDDVELEGRTTMEIHYL